MSGVVVAGHVCLDLLPAMDSVPTVEPGTLSAIGPLELRAGGCVANTGSLLADLGVATRLYADVGSDALAGPLMSLLASGGADVSGLRVTAASTSYSIVLQPPGRDRTFWHHVGANASFDGAAIDLRGAELVHLGYPSILPAMLADGGEPLRALLRRARAADVTTSLDLAVVANPTPDVQASWRALFDATLPSVDVLTPSVDDLSSATGRPVHGDPESIAREARALVRLGVAIATVSAGPRGMALATGPADRFARGGVVLSRLGAEWFDRDIWLPVTPVDRPATTTGAGDAATAGFLSGLIHGLEPHATLELAARTAVRRILGRDGDA